jgi:hypothetical protein
MVGSYGSCGKCLVSQGVWYLQKVSFDGHGDSPIVKLVTL